MFFFELNMYTTNKTNMFPKAKQVQLEIIFFMQGPQFYPVYIHNRTNLHLSWSTAIFFIMRHNYYLEAISYRSNSAMIYLNAAATET